MQSGVAYEVDIENRSIHDDPKGWLRLVPTIRPELGREYSLLYVTYTSGDSNGRYPDLRHEFVDLYETEAQAVEAAKAIRAHYDNVKFGKVRNLNFEERNTLTIKHGDGTELRSHYPWLGYFESLEDVFVTPVVLNKSRTLRF